MSELQKLTYGEEDRFVPIPPHEQNLQTIKAEHFVDIPMDGFTPGQNLLEGLIFNRAGNLFLTHIAGNRILKVDMETREVSMFAELPDNMQAAAVKIHKDGRFFLAVAYSDRGGMMVVLTPEGELEQTLLEGRGHIVDDLVFDEEGGIYYTDLAGTPQDPCSGVFYIEPDLGEVHMLVGGMIESNGIALAPDGKGIWVTEYGREQLWYFKRPADGITLDPCSSRVAYHTTGIGGTDSLCTDEDGNVYMALCGQGRYLVFNPLGMPIGQIVIPGRERGEMLRTTHPQIRYGTDEIYLTAADFTTGKSAIYRARAFARAQQTYQFM